MSTSLQVFGKLGRYSKVFRCVAKEYNLKIRYRKDWVEAWMDRGVAFYYDLSLCGQSEEAVLDAIFRSDGPIFVTGMSKRYRKKAPKNVHWVEDWSTDEAPTRIRDLIHQAMIQQMESVKKRQKAWTARKGFNSRKGTRRMPFSRIAESISKPGMHILATPYKLGVDELLSSLIWSHMADKKTQIITAYTGHAVRQFIGLISGMSRTELPGSPDPWYNHPSPLNNIRQASSAYKNFLQRGICISTCDPKVLQVGSILYTMRSDSTFTAIDSPKEFYRLWKRSGGGSTAEMMKVLRADSLERGRSTVLVLSLKKSLENRKHCAPSPADIPYFGRIKKHVDQVFMLFDPQYYNRSSILRPDNNPYRELQIGRFKGPSFKFTGYSAVDLDPEHRRIIDQNEP